MDRFRNVYIFYALVLLFFVGCAEQQTSFPSKPITIVVPWDAGGGTDGLARSIALQASDEFDQVVNVLNRPGGSGAIGHSFGATARPDGYTVTMITFELCTYSPLGRVDLGPSNFKPVLQLNADPAAITVQADSPWQTLDDFIAHAQENPGEVTIGNSGPGAVWHIAALRLEKETGVTFTHVPHNGAKPAVTQLLGGHLDAVSVSPSEVLQYLELGSLRCLGIMSEERYAQLPTVPTLQEQNIDLVHGTWRGLAVPPETSDEIVSVLEAGFTKAFHSEAFQETARKAMLGLKLRTPDEFKNFLQREQESISELLTNSELTVKSGADVTWVPRFYAFLFILFTIVLGIQSFTRQKTDEEAKGAYITTLSFCLLTLILYAILLFILGYIISTILYLCVMFVYLGERNPIRIGSWSIAVVFIVFGIFKFVLDVPLP